MIDSGCINFKHQYTYICNTLSHTIEGATKICSLPCSVRRIHFNYLLFIILKLNFLLLNLLFSFT